MAEEEKHPVEGFVAAARPDAPEPDVQPKRQRGALVRTLVCSVIALLLGVVVGVLAYPYIPLPGFRGSLIGRSTVSEAELDSPLGTYTYGGQTVKISVREAIEELTTLDAAKNADGSYDVPSVDSVLAIARDRIVMLDAQAHGITASEEDARAYAMQTYGTDDYATIALNYNMSAEQVSEHMLRAATLKKLRDEVTTTESLPEPQAPEAPEAGAEDEPSQEYARYVIELLGDEWDANANTWAREDGPFREQLRDYTISNEEATYSAAQAAYYVARAQYAATQRQIANEWTAYINEMLSQASVDLSSLVA